MLLRRKHMEINWNSLYTNGFVVDTSIPLNKIPLFLSWEMSRESWRHVCWFWDMISWFLRSSFSRSNLSISCSDWTFSCSNFEIRSEKSMKLLRVSKFVNGLESGSFSFGASFSFSNSNSKFLRYAQYCFIRNASLRTSIEETSMYSNLER